MGGNVIFWIYQVTQSAKPWALELLIAKGRYYLTFDVTIYCESFKTRGYSHSEYDQRFRDSNEFVACVRKILARENMTLHPDDEKHLVGQFNLLIDNND